MIDIQGCVENIENWVTATEGDEGELAYGLQLKYMLGERFPSPQGAFFSEFGKYPMPAPGGGVEALREARAKRLFHCQREAAKASSASPTGPDSPLPDSVRMIGDKW